ncbi:MAG: hypothetical protein NZM00_06160 [Anaerolinea sp.]|nr:hypothetical protein [Anaerolinea sp.]
MSAPTRFEQARITQLIGPYSPTEPPRLTLDFGDYLSLLWRLDQCATLPLRARYYRTCALALAAGLNFRTHPLARLVELTLPGEIYAQIPNLPYRVGRLVDAHDRKAAIQQLIALRQDVLRLGTYPETWVSGYPGSGIIDAEVRERVFAVLFTALQGQFGNFARLLFVIDIVLGNLLLGYDVSAEIALPDLVSRFGYPDPADPQVRKDFHADRPDG